MARKQLGVTPSNSADALNKSYVYSNTTGVNLIGTFASLPAAGTAGRAYRCTDTNLTLYDNGSTWDRFGPDGHAFTAPPTFGSATAPSTGSATFSANKGDRLVQVTGSGSGDGLWLEYDTLSPTSNYTITAFIEESFVIATHTYCGIAIGQASTGEWIVFGPSYNSGIQLIYTEWDTVNDSTRTSQGVMTENDLDDMPNWLRIRDDNTNRYFEFSYNGLDWLELWSHARTTFLTADRVGWGMHSDNNTSGNYCRLRSWKQT
jgi:hypothetical protein